MRIRPIIVASVVLLVTGCSTGTPDPSPGPTQTTGTPSPTTEGRCSPDDAGVSFGELTPAPRTAIGYRTITTDGSIARTNTVIQWGYESSVSFSIAGDPRTGNLDWTEFLVDELNEQEDSSPEFGDPALDLDPNPVEPSVPGDYVVLYDIEQLATPFVLDCPGRGGGEGTLTSSRGGVGITVAQCASPLPAEDPLADALDQACAA